MQKFYIIRKHITRQLDTNNNVLWKRCIQCLVNEIIFFSCDFSGCFCSLDKIGHNNNIINRLKKQRTTVLIFRKIMFVYIIFNSVQNVKNRNLHLRRAH